MVKAAPLMRLDFGCLGNTIRLCGASCSLNICMKPDCMMTLAKHNHLVHGRDGTSPLQTKILVIVTWTIYLPDCSLRLSMSMIRCLSAPVHIELASVETAEVTSSSDNPPSQPTPQSTKVWFSPTPHKTTLTSNHVSTITCPSCAPSTSFHPTIPSCFLNHHTSHGWRRYWSSTEYGCCHWVRPILFLRSGEMC